jgi:NAD(P)-dependent dehydrogenase (short-subunit alcohol dehydrogenase family)
MIVKGKYIIVSGAGPGLGSKLAIHAALEGAAGVAIGGLEPAKIEETLAAVRSAKTDCKLISAVADIRDPEQCRALAEATVTAFGRIDALINNAYTPGRSMDDRPADTDFADWEDEYTINVIGTLKMSQAVLPQMRKQQAGSIVMVCTMGTKMVPLVDQAGYNASKSALYNAARALAKGVGKDNIRVNCLHPGFMWGTPVISAMPLMMEKWGLDEAAAKAKIIAHNALPRIVTDDEAAKAGLFLASDYASGVTGATLDVNGGAFMP